MGFIAKRSNRVCRERSCQNSRNLPRGGSVGVIATQKCPQKEPGGNRVKREDELFLGGILGFVVVALYLPVFSLVDQIGK